MASSDGREWDREREDDEFLLEDFRAWRLGVGIGEISDGQLARVFGVSRSLMASARTVSAWQRRNTVRRIWYALGGEIRAMGAEETQAWISAVAAGERESARERMEAIEFAAAGGDSDSAISDDASAAIDGDGTMPDASADSGVDVVVADDAGAGDSLVDDAPLSGEGGESPDAGASSRGADSDGAGGDSRADAQGDAALAAGASSRGNEANGVGGAADGAIDGDSDILDRAGVADGDNDDGVVCAGPSAAAEPDVNGVGAGDAAASDGGENSVRVGASDGDGGAAGESGIGFVDGDSVGVSRAPRNDSGPGDAPLDGVRRSSSLGGKRGDSAASAISGVSHRGRGFLGGLFGRNRSSGAVAGVRREGEFSDASPLSCEEAAPVSAVADEGAADEGSAREGAASDDSHVGADAFVLEIKRRMEQWTRKSDGDAAAAQWAARDDPEGEIAALRAIVEEAETIEEIARACAGPVLREIPGLSLEDARASALMKIDGWTPTGDGDEPPGLYGDAPLLFHFGEECSYVDDGARAVAFAPNLAYEEETGYAAVDLRYGVTPEERMGRYYCADYLERPKRVGFYRLANRLPERPYPDHDWFFGCEGLPRPGGVWMPSAAEVAAFYYEVKETMAAFRGTEAEGSAYMRYLNLLRQECRYLLFDPDYWMTFYFHSKGKSIGGSTRSMERQSLRSQIAASDAALSRMRRRRFWRRFARGALRAGTWPARALWRRLFSRGAAAAIPADMIGMFVGSADWEPRARGWSGRDRTRWYEPGAGALSEQGDRWLEQLPDAMASLWGNRPMPRVRSVPGPGEAKYKHGKWRVPRK